MHDTHHFNLLYWFAFGCSLFCACSMLSIASWARKSTLLWVQVQVAETLASIKTVSEFWSAFSRPCTQRKGNYHDGFLFWVEPCWTRLVSILYRVDPFFIHVYMPSRPSCPRSRRVFGTEAMDAGNLLKPLLARGELRCVGATTLDEYRQYIEKARHHSLVKWVLGTSCISLNQLESLVTSYEQHWATQCATCSITRHVMPCPDHVLSPFWSTMA